MFAFYKEPSDPYSVLYEEICKIAPSSFNAFQWYKFTFDPTGVVIEGINSPEYADVVFSLLIEPSMANQSCWVWKFTKADNDDVVNHGSFPDMIWQVLNNDQGESISMEKKMTLIDTLMVGTFINLEIPYAVRENNTFAPDRDLLLRVLHSKYKDDVYVSTDSFSVTIAVSKYISSMYHVEDGYITPQHHTSLTVFPDQLVDHKEDLYRSLSELKYLLVNQFGYELSVDYMLMLADWIKYETPIAKKNDNEPW